MHFRKNGSCHHIAGSELFKLVIAVHEPFFLLVSQNGSFSSDGFGYEKVFIFRVIKHRRMKLHKLHIRQESPGSVCHTDAVSRCHIRICRHLIQSAKSAGSANDGVGNKYHKFFFLLVIGQYTFGFLTLRDQIHGKHLFYYGDILSVLCGKNKLIAHFFSRRVSGMDNSVFAMGRFTSESKLILAFTVKLHAEFQ